MERPPEAAAAAALRARFRRDCMLEADMEMEVVRERVSVGAPLDEVRWGWGERVSMLWQRCRAEVKGEEEGPRQAGLDGARAAGDAEEAGGGRPRGLGKEVVVLERSSRGAVVVLAPMELRRAEGAAMKGEVSREVVRAGAAGWEGVEGAQLVGVAGAGAVVEAEEEPESETRREVATAGQSSWAMPCSPCGPPSSSSLPPVGCSGCSGLCWGPSSSSSAGKRGRT